MFLPVPCDSPELQGDHLCFIFILIVWFLPDPGDFYWLVITPDFYFFDHRLQKISF